jgi:hypothetical protein
MEELTLVDLGVKMSSNRGDFDDTARQQQH